MSKGRWFTLLFVAIAVSCTLKSSSNPVYVTQPDTGQRFKIYQSLISSNPDSKDTILWVILCTDDLSDLDTIFEEIKAFHDDMNGTSKSLTITLYRNKIELINCRKLEEKIYN